MCRDFLMGERKITDEAAGNMKLEYYLLQETRGFLEEVPLYGIKIVKFQSVENGVSREKEAAGAVTYSRDFALYLIQKLMDYEVTPYAMLEIIDDLVTKELWRTTKERQEERYIV